MFSKKKPPQPFAAEKLFEPFAFKSKTAKNRLAALPMEANDAAPGGVPSEQTLHRYRRLARGGWGIIFIEAIAPSPGGLARARQLMLTPDTLPGIRSLVETIKSEDPGAIVIVQLNHAGRYGIAPVIAYNHPELDSWHGLAHGAKPASQAELEKIESDMRALVRLAAQTGADGADLKCCHGYLAIELLRPFNRRDDAFGGAFENRSRLLRAMYEEAAPFIEKGFLVGTRLSLYEGIEGGLGDGGLAPDIAAALDMMKNFGAEWLCETAGIPYYNPDVSRPAAKDANRIESLERHRRLAAEAKNLAPGLAVVGTGYSIHKEGFPAIAEAALAAGAVDFIGLGRQNFADPETPRKLREGDLSAVNLCHGCSKRGCPWLLRNGVEAGCVMYDEYYFNIRKELKKRLKEEEKD